MKIINRTDFLDILRAVKPGAGEGGLGGEKLILFDNGWIRSVNDNLSVSYKFETGIEGAVAFNQLYDALRILKTNTIAISQDAENIQFKCGYTTLKLLKATGEEYKKIKDRVASVNSYKAEWLPIPKNLLEGLKLSLLAAEDSAIGRLTGIMIVDSTILSTNNYQIAKYDMGESIGELPVRLKTSAVSNLVSMKKTFDFVGVTLCKVKKWFRTSPEGELPEEGEFREVDAVKWLHLKKGDLIVSIGGMPTADYPLEDVLAVFGQWPEDGSDTVYTMPAGLERYIKRTELLAGIGVGELNFDTTISLKTEGGNLIVTGQKNVGAVVTSVPYHEVLPHLTVAPGFLKKVLKLTRSFRVSQDKKMVLFETPNFKILTIAEAETAPQVTEEGGGD